MTQTQKFEVTPLARVAIKVSGIVIWRVASESGNDYNVVVVDGHVSSCETTKGEPCKGFRYRQTCHHAMLVLERESARKAHIPALQEMPTSAARNAFDEQASREALPLNGNRAFSLLK